MKTRAIGVVNKGAWLDRFSLGVLNEGILFYFAKGFVKKLWASSCSDSKIRRRLKSIDYG